MASIPFLFEAGTERSVYRPFVCPDPPAGTSLESFPQVVDRRPIRSARSLAPHSRYIPTDKGPGDPQLIHRGLYDDLGVTRSLARVYARCLDTGFRHG